MHAAVARPGIVLIDAALNLIASNREAVQILTYPETPDRIPQLDSWVADRIRSRLLDRGLPGQVNFLSRFKSAKRTYLCRSFPLTASGNASPGVSGPSLLLLFERNTGNGVTLGEISERFGLTPREQETVKLLLQGLTSKEIAERMKISPNTVKAFIRLVMVKMNVSTRSGIIGKIAESHNGGPS